MPNKSNNPKNQPGSGQNLGRAGDMSNQSGNSGSANINAGQGSRPANWSNANLGQGGTSGRSGAAGQEPKRKWGQEEFHGNNAEWGKEGSKAGKDLRWGQTSHESDAVTGASHPAGEARPASDQPVHPGHASNQGQGSDISRKAEKDPGAKENRTPRGKKNEDSPNTDMDWNQ